MIHIKFLCGVIKFVVCVLCPRLQIWVIKYVLKMCLKCGAHYRASFIYSNGVCVEFSHIVCVAIIQFLLFSLNMLNLICRVNICTLV